AGRTEGGAKDRCSLHSAPLHRPTELGGRAACRLLPAMVIVDLVQGIRVGSDPVVGAGSCGCREQLPIIVARAAEQNVDDVAFGGDVAITVRPIIAISSQGRDRHAAPHCENESADRKTFCCHRGMPFWPFGFSSYIQNRQPDKSSLTLAGPSSAI
ncbi:hypothetical protein, partial [Mesorhizobium sp.]|uniref:hypothetical protein n=1 Tax=Mesorhizobium sp. TaxID=1871066 RepID=UPI00338E38CE